MENDFGDRVALAGELFVGGGFKVGERKCCRRSFCY